MRLLMLILASAALTGCPVPPDESADQGGQGGPGGAGGPGGQGGQGGPGADGGKTGKSGGPGGSGGGGMGGGLGGQGGQGGGQGGSGAVGGGGSGVLMVLEEMKGQQTQDEVKAADHFTVSGEVSGACEGTIRIDVIDGSLAGAPPSPDGQIPGPLTTLAMDAIGAFSVVVPKGKPVNLSALCDNDKDGKITNSVDALSLGAQLGEISGDQDGVSLELSALSPSGVPEGAGGGGPGAGGAGAGGPGAGGAGAGGPGAGGPGAGGPGGEGGPGAGGAGGPGAGGPGAGGPGAGAPEGGAPSGGTDQPL
ncbi:MAG: hypothetical protein ACI8RZ_005842 [Myxococcota bacterium]|jgi:hypothetical protein